MGDMEPPRNIVILTGAGISAESGIDTFRGDGGLWENHRVEDVATPEAFARDPNLVLRFYDQRREAVQTKQPNLAHEALAILDAQWKGDLLIVTQNIDDLHERAGAQARNACCICMASSSRPGAPIAMPVCAGPVP
jgi:NAD-dependent deacetylase